jgi:hypothetical protein
MNEKQPSRKRRGDSRQIYGQIFIEKSSLWRKSLIPCNAKNYDKAIFSGGKKTSKN